MKLFASLLLGSLAAGVMGQKLTNPVQTYFTPLPEKELLESFVNVRDTAAGPVVNLISIAVAAAGTVIYYDHHEDTYDTMFLADVSQKQGSTEIWGDGDCSNGGAPGIASVRDPIDGSTTSCIDANDYLDGGDVIVLMSEIPAVRDNTTFFFDGKDRILATLPIAMTRSAYPKTPGALLAGAVEVLNRDDWGTTFVAPVGNDTTTTLETTFPFTFSVFYIMAGFDNTRVILPNGGGEQILDSGESIILPVMEGDMFTADRPIQVDLLAGDEDSNYEFRWFAQIDRNKWSTEYVSPVAESNTETAFWFYNPSDTTITINYEGGNIMAGSLTVAPGSQLAIAGAVGSTDATIFIGDNDVETTTNFKGLSVTTKYSGIRFYSNDVFYGLVQVDNGFRDGDGRFYDWGFPLIPTDELTAQALVGLGYGCTSLNCAASATAGNDIDRSVVWVTPVANTTVFVDFDGDGTFDVTYPVAAYSSLRLTDADSTMPNQDLTGAIIASATVAGGDNQIGVDAIPVKIAVVWGQNPSTSGTGDAAGLDLGTAVVPLATPFVSKQVVGVENPDGTPDTRLLVDQVGDKILYEITITNSGFAFLSGIEVEDTLIDDTLQGPFKSVNNTFVAVTGANPILNKGETWTYTGFYIATQGDIDNFGLGTTIVENIATVKADSIPPIVVTVITPVRLANISGTVFEDTDGDDVGDTELKDVLITLYNASSSEILGTTLTDDDGFYRFTDLQGGNYTVTQDNINATFTDVNDADGGPDLNSIFRSLLGGLENVDNNFIDERLGSIDGTVADEAGAPIVGVNITLTDLSTNETFTVLTDSNGEYEYLDVRPGNYSLVEINLDEYPTSQSDQDSTPDGDEGDQDSTVDDEILVTLTPAEKDDGNDFVDILGSMSPSASPSMVPTAGPSVAPSDEPSAAPSGKPTNLDSASPTVTASGSPTSVPSGSPSGGPSSSPSLTPSGSPSTSPSLAPSGSPSTSPSDVPSATPSNAPSVVRSVMPSPEPSGRPTNIFSDAPSSEPSSEPSSGPSAAPSSAPSLAPSQSPTVLRSLMPSPSPSMTPSLIDSEMPSLVPSGLPSWTPSAAPFIRTAPPNAENCCRGQGEELTCEVCIPYRSDDFCAKEESFPALITERTKKFRNNFTDVEAAGHWFHYLEDKIAAYAMSALSGVPVPEVFCCVTSLDDLSGAECLGAIPAAKTSIVIKSTNFHSSEGVYVLTNFTQDAINNPNATYMQDLLKGMATSFSDVASELASRDASKIIVEEFIGDELPVEYKFHVVNGSIGAIDIIDGRGGDCPCYAVIDTKGERLDKFGCFQPGGLEMDNGECSAIDFAKGRQNCGPVKRDLYLCDNLKLVSECLLNQMMEVALKLGAAIGVYMRVDMFVVGDTFYVQEYSANHMNGIRHCAARAVGGCIDSCFLGKMWDAAGSTYGGPATLTPSVLTGFRAKSAEEQCAVLGTVKSTYPLNPYPFAVCEEPVLPPALNTPPPTPA